MADLNLELVTSRLCPYGVRCLALLGAAGLPYRCVVVPDELPDWVKELSPAGVVPVMRVGGAVVHETSAICELVSELAAVALLPQNALARAVARGWAAHATTCNPLVMRVLAAQSEADRQGAIDKLAACSSTLERSLEAESLPKGSPFVDAAYVAFFSRLWAMEKTIGEDLVKDVERFRRWGEAVLGASGGAHELVETHGVSFVEHFRARGTAFFNVTRGGD